MCWHQFGRQCSECAFCSGANIFGDVPPEVAIDGLVSGCVIYDGDSWQLYDAALNCIHQPEVGDCPWEQCAFGITGAAQEERSRREVNDAVYADALLYGF